MNESKLDLIAKLLAKAESTTPEEAEALTEHAERLMLRHGVDQALIDARREGRGQSREEIVKERMLFTGSYARDLREIGIRTAHSLESVRPLVADQVGVGSILYLVGFASDARQARALTESLHVQAMVAMRTWWLIHRDSFWRHPESMKRRARSGFIRGFAAGAAERIAATRRSVIEESGSGTELVLADRREQVNAAAATWSTGHARRRQGADFSAFRSGRTSGQRANTGNALSNI